MGINELKSKKIWYIVIGKEVLRSRVDMRLKFEKKDIITIPNILSFFRIVLIPIIVVLYVKYERYEWTTLVILLSGLTDIVDGYIARHYNMISDFGKILDPIADKLTQAAILLCLVSRFPNMLYIFIFMAVKETVMGVTGLLSIKSSGQVHGADWHGKLTTVMLYAMMVTHIVWYNIPKNVSEILLLVVGAVMLVSLTLYCSHNVEVIKKNKK